MELFEESLELAGEATLLENLPQGRAVDGVVGFAKVDEACVCGDVKFKGVAEDLVECEEVVGSTSTTAKASLSTRGLTPSFPLSNSYQALFSAKLQALLPYSFGFVHFSE